MGKRVQLALAVLALSALWFGVRVSNADSTMTTDETLWYGRSADFYLALVKGEYDQTYRMAHPGVPVMWAGGLGVLATCPEYIHEDGFYVRALSQSSESFREVGCDPHTVFVAERLAKIAAQAVMIAVSLWLLSTLMPLRGLVFTGLLIAFSPWQAGLDQLLHVDGMFATTVLLALSATAAMTKWSMRRTSTSWEEIAGWLGVGIALALAVLTRSAAVVFLLPIGLAILAATIQASRAAGKKAISLKSLMRVLGSGVMVVFGCAVTVFALFPALWVAPRHVAERLLGFTDIAINEGHEFALYYNGEIVEGDPGSLFYLDAMIWRSTPTEWVALAGALMLAVGLILYRRRQADAGKRSGSTFWILIGLSLVFIFLYGTGITLAAKKFERYFIMVSPLIAVMGGIALSELWTIIKRPPVRRASTLIAVVLVVAQIASWSNARSYMLDYFNPVVGGHEAATTKFQLGWGQGGDQLASWLVERHEGETIHVRSSSTLGLFTVFVPPGSDVQFERGIVTGVSDWYHTDYYVSGFQETQRELDRSWPLFEDREPVHTVQVGDVTYFKTYEVSSLPVPEELWQETDCRHIAANGVQLMSVEQRGGDVLVILRIDDPAMADEAWISIDESQQTRIPVVPAEEGMLVGIVFPDSSVKDVEYITIGKGLRALMYDFPLGTCTPHMDE